MTNRRNAWTRRAAPALLQALTFALGLSACGGGGGDSSLPPPTVTLSVTPGTLVLGQSATLSWTANDGTACTASGGWSGALTADFQSIQEHVFTPVCTVCHAGGAAPQGLRLDAANSHAMLVGVPSNEVSSVLRVAPGRPDDSYLIQKLEGRAAVGARMPLGGPYLDSATITVIRQWIAAGAPLAVAPQEPRP